MIEINLQKLDRGIRTGTVTVRRGGKIFQRKQRLGQKEREEDKQLVQKPIDTVSQLKLGTIFSIAGKDRVVSSIDNEKGIVTCEDESRFIFETINNHGEIKGWTEPKPKPEPKPEPEPEPEPEPKPEAFPKVGDTVFVSGKPVVIEAINRSANSVKIVGGGGWLDRSSVFLELTSVSNTTGHKEYDKKITDTINKFDDLLAKGKTFKEAISDIVGKPADMKSSKMSVVMKDDTTENRQKAMDSLTRFNNIISSKYSDKKFTVTIQSSSSSRSSANKLQEEVYIGSQAYGDMDGNIFHEISHILEQKFEGNRDAADKFLRKRTDNFDDTKEMADICPGVGYARGEITAPDAFIHPYVGRMYHSFASRGLRSTEILSMGAENFVSPALMKNFYKKDKEHFALTLTILAGELL